MISVTEGRSLELAQYRCALLADTNDALDDSGRPIGEIRASEPVRKRVRSQFSICPYPGSRSSPPRLMNTSALNDVLRHWPSVLGMLFDVRQLCATVNPPTLIELAQVATTVLAVPAFLIYGRMRCEAVPAFVAAAHKATAGLFGLFKNRLLARVAEGARYDEVTESVVALYRYAEESGAFRSRTGIEVCAGPPQLVREALEVLVVGTPGRADLRAWTEFVSDRGELLRYSAAVVQLTLWLNVFAPWCRERVEQFQALIDGLGIAPSIQPECRGISHPSIERLLTLPSPVRRSYARGASVLFIDPRHRRFDEVLRNATDPLTDEVTQVLPSRIARATGWNRDDSRVVSLARELHHTKVGERAAIELFNELRVSLHTILGWSCELGECTPDLVTELFGPSPSVLCAEMIGMSA